MLTFIPVTHQYVHETLYLDYFFWACAYVHIRYVQYSGCASSM